MADQPQWHRVVAWISLGARGAEGLLNGDRVFVNGSVVKPSMLDFER